MAGSCTGTKGTKAAGLALAALFALFMAGSVSFMAMAGKQPGDLGFGLLGAAMCVAFTVYFLWLAREAAAVLTWDEHGLTKRRWFGTQYASWHDLTGYEIRRGGMGEPEYHLQRGAGKPIVVDFDVLSTNGWDLLDELLRRLDPLKQRKLAELAGQGRELKLSPHQRSAARVGAAVLVAITVAMTLAAWYTRGPGRPGMFGLVGLFAAIVLFCMIVQSLQAGRRIVLHGQGLTRIQGARRTELAWPFIERIELTRGSSNSTTFESLIVRGRGETVMLSAMRPDYLLCVEWIVQHAINAEFVDRTSVVARPIWRYHLERIVNPAATPSANTEAALPPPRRPAWTVQLALAAGLICLQVGLVLLPDIGRNRQERAALGKPPVVAEARVSRYCGTDKPGEGHIHFTFMAKAGPTEGRSRPLGAALTRYKPGDPVMIHYPSGLPERSSLSTEPLDLPHARPDLQVISLGCLLAGLPLLVFGGLATRRCVREQRVLRSSGAWSAGGR